MIASTGQISSCATACRRHADEARRLVVITPGSRASAAAAAGRDAAPSCRRPDVPVDGLELR
jgi:hypothetical protein